MAMPGEASSPQDVKEAARKAEHIGRSVQALDKVVNGIKGRYDEAQRNLQTLKYELNVKQAQLDFTLKARENLAQTIKDNKAREEQLRLCQRKCERIMNDTCVNMKDTHSMANAGRPEKGVAGLRKSNKDMISMELEHQRGYHCKDGSTLRAADARPRLASSMPTLPRMKGL